MFDTSGFQKIFQSAIARKHGLPAYAPLFVVLLVATARAASGEDATNRAQTPARPKKIQSLRAGSASLQTRRNVGKARYEQAQYAEALNEFARVVASGHALAPDYLDLGLAQMQLGKYDEALGSFTTAKQMDPGLRAADYNLGILYKREARYPEAEAALQALVRVDPEDAAAWFNLGSVQMSAGKLEPAFDSYSRVLKMGFDRAQNFYVASLFRTYTVLVRLHRQAEAQPYFGLHEKYRHRVPDISVQAPALEAGRYGEVVLPSVAGAVTGPETVEGVTFADVTSKLGISSPGSQAHAATLTIEASHYNLGFARAQILPLFGPSVAIGDYDGDGRPDLYVVNPAGKNRLLHNNADGTFTDVTEQAGVAGPGGSLNAAFGDFDNSGHPSLFVAGLGGITLYRNRGNGTFTDETEKNGLKGPPGELATAVSLVDADNDGQLDVLVTVYTDLSQPPKTPSFEFPQDFDGAGSHLYRNNGNGTFSDITKQAGLALLRGRTREAVFADFNGDGFSDLLLVQDDAPPWLYLNQGGAKFVLAKVRNFTRPAYGAQVADFNHDGNFDLVLWTSSGFEVWLNRGDATFTPTQGLPKISAPPGAFAARGTIADLNGDGYDDLLVADAESKWHFLANRGGAFREAPLTMPPVAADSSLTPAWLVSPADLDLITAARDGQIRILQREGHPARWLEIGLRGEKSNRQGVGAVLEVKAGNFYRKLIVTGTPVRVFTGSLPQVDVVRVTWPNAIVQNQIHVPTNKEIEVRESERLASSCPFVYGWDGKRYVFITDVLGAAPLGELSPDGSVMTPNPQEYVRLPRELQPQNGRYVFHFTDEMREVDYFDRVRLMVVDHSADEEIYANEIYSSTPTAPALYAIRGKHPPVSAYDDEGHDVLPLLLHADGEYIAGFQRSRILGLANLHTLTLDLGSFPDRSPVALWLQGWVLWPDSNSARALSTQKTQMVGPYLQVRNTRGEWVTVIPEMGLPSGTGRTMRLDLAGKFLSADHHVRIVTNLCVYWDQIFFTTDESPVSKPVLLPMRSADLHYRGFSTPHSDPQGNKPDSYDYEALDSTAPWDPAKGHYTRYGVVSELLQRSDDRLVALAPGDELTVSFDAGPRSLAKPGWQEDLFLQLVGWAKDGEPNTLAGNNSLPLPFGKMKHYPYDRGTGSQQPGYRRYLLQYQTRKGYRLLPPLAPASSSMLR